MASGFEEPTQTPSGSDTGNFECNICFDLAQDPILTLCGHLFCWPCLYRWLHIHSHSTECPVCKALIQEQNLVPLYGRGNYSTDPRSRSQHGSDDTPNRPSGQRPETAPQLITGLGFDLEGSASRRSAIFSHLRSENGGSLFHPLFSARMRDSPADALYGNSALFSYRNNNVNNVVNNQNNSRRGQMLVIPLPVNLRQQLEFCLKERIELALTERVFLDKYESFVQLGIKIYPTEALLLPMK